MSTFWNKQIQRADYLAGESSGSKELLTFYAQLLRAQQEILRIVTWPKKLVTFRRSGNRSARCSIVHDRIIEECCTAWPTSLASESHIMLAEPDIIADKLLEYWSSPSDRQFFPKSILQPYARWLAETRTTPVGRACRR